MTRPLDNHLDEAEIEALAGACLAGPADPDQVDESFRRGAQHTERCPECREKVRVQAEMQQVFKGLRAESAMGPSRGCPRGVDWNAVVQGLLPEKRSKDLLSHAARCRFCGRQMKSAIAVTAAEATPEEEQMIGSLRIHHPAWRSAMAHQMRSTAAVRRWWRLPRLRLNSGQTFGWACGVAVVAVLAFWGPIRIAHRPTTEALIAEAYGEHRTLEPRWGGAIYGPVRQERGEGGSNLEKPAALLSAEAGIAEGLKRHPNDGTWLDAKARADLLDGHYQSAIESLERAKESQPKSRDVLTDLATAYFMRAEADGKAVDYGRSVDLLGQVLSDSPEDGVALFNRAIAEERLALFDDALADWNRFLKVEKDPSWLVEGRHRRSGVLEKIKKRQGLNGRLPMEPGEAVQQLRARSGDNRDLKLAPDEDYLEIGLAQWLSGIEPLQGADGKSGLRPSEPAKALTLLAQTLRKEHGDEWLAELLGSAQPGAWQSGVRELSASAAARRQGDTTEQLRHAKAARTIFHQAHNRVGLAAADLEYADGLNNAQQGLACDSVVKEGLRLASADKEPWIKINLWLEASTCEGSRGAQADAESDAMHAATLVERAGYEGLRLETLYYLDGVITPWSAPVDAWDRMRAGLEEFWTVRSSGMYGCYLLSDMVFGAEQAGMWNLAVAAGRESVLFHMDLPDRFGEAAARQYLAQAAEAAGDRELADAEFDRADALLRQLPASDREGLVTLEVQRASLEVRENKLDAARALLMKAGRDLSQLHSQYASMPYHEALGELELREGRQADAERDLLKAVAILESDATTLGSDPERLVWHQDGARAYRDLLEIYSRQRGDAAKSFAFEEWYRAAPMRAMERAKVRRQGARNAGLREVSFQEIGSREDAELKPGSAVLSWISFPSGIAEWLWDGKSAKLAWVGVPEGSLRTALQQFIELCADPRSDAELRRQAGAQIYAWLVAPFGAGLKDGSSLSIESDETMPQIPYQALQAPDGRFLGERLMVIDSPGLAYERALRNKERNWRQMVALSVGNPLIGREARAGLSPLPAADAEAREVGELFRHHYLLTGNDASLARVTALLHQAEVLHFAGHAQVAGAQPGLLLAGNAAEQPAVLGADQLRSRDLTKLRLVVLSGCSTAAAERGLDDPESLVRVFLGAGVPHVLASNWRVDSRVTQSLMTSFYAGLMRGDSVPGALASAQQAIRNHPETAHPYYWAAFSEFGG